MVFLNTVTVLVDYTMRTEEILLRRENVVLCHFKENL